MSQGNIKIVAGNTGYASLIGMKDKKTGNYLNGLTTLTVTVLNVDRAPLPGQTSPMTWVPASLGGYEATLPPSDDVIAGGAYFVRFEDETIGYRQVFATTAQDN